MLPLIIRHRHIDNKTLEEIQTVVNDHWDKGRTQISRALCLKWNWVQPNGRLKDMACREVLLTLNRKGLLNLPPSLITTSNNKRKRKSIPIIEVDKSPLNINISKNLPIELKLVRHTKLDPLYKSLIEQYHYLGYRQIIGNHLKYIAFINDRPVACLGWGSAAWSVFSREKFIGWNKSVKNQNLCYLINNTRFLVLPWVFAKCLASKILSLNAKRICRDWLDIYKHPIYLLETFVQQNRFKGTCYKAANWIHVGETKGTSKKGNQHFAHGNIKDVYLYPLRKDFKKKLIN